MNQELIKALQERIAAGQTEEDMKGEALAIGYTEEQFQAAYDAAAQRTRGEEAAFPGIGAYTALVWRRIGREQQVAWKTLLVAVAAFVILGSLGFSSSFFWSYDDPQISFIIMMLFVPLVAGILSLVVSVAMVRILLVQDQSPLYRDSIGFAVKHLIPVTLLSLYVTIVVQVGYALFIIPGIIATVYLLFSVPILASGQAVGFAAMAESTVLVMGRFWAVALRFLVATFSIVAAVWVAVFAGIYLFSMMLSSSFANLTLFPFAFALVLAVFVFALYAGTVALVVLFELVTTIPSPHKTTTPLTTIARFYQVIVGVVVVVLAIAVALLSYGLTAAFW